MKGTIDGVPVPGQLVAKRVRGLRLETVPEDLEGGTAARIAAPASRSSAWLDGAGATMGAAVEERLGSGFDP